MPISNFPYGFLSGLTVKGLPILQTNPGNVYWVDNSSPSGAVANYGNRFSGGSDNNPGTFQKPFATIAQGLSVCSQGGGDILIVKPGHIEVVNAAPGATNSAINMAPVYDPTGSVVISNGGTAGYNFALNNSDVAIIGLGTGNNRPQIVWGTATGATINVLAAGMSMQNFIFCGNFLNVASAFTMLDASAANTTIFKNVMTVGAVTRTIFVGSQAVPTSANGIYPGTTVLNQLTGTAGGTGTYLVDNTYLTTTASSTVVTGPIDFNIESCEFRDLGTALNLMVGVTTSAGAGGSDGLRLANCRFNSLATAASASGTLVSLGTNIDRMTITDNVVNSTATSTGAALVVAGANNMTNVQIGRNIVYKPTTAATGLLVTSSSTASTGIMHENQGWSLATATGLMVSTGTKLGFSNNYCTITGTADKNAIINPTQA